MFPRAWLDAPPSLALEKIWLVHFDTALVLNYKQFKVQVTLSLCGALC